MLPMNTPDADLLLTSREAAQARGVTEQHQRRERCRGNGPPFLKDSETGSIWYEWSTLAEWCEQNRRYLRWPGEQTQ